MHDATPLPGEFSGGFIGKIAKLLRGMLAGMLAFYFALVILQVIFRYVLNQSLFWAEEVVRYSLVWSVMLGSALVALERAHIRIDVIDQFLSPDGRRRLTQFCDLLLIAISLLLLWSGVEFIQRTMMQSSASLGVPMWFVYGAVPVGAFLQAGFCVAIILRPDAAPHQEDAA